VKKRKFLLDFLLYFGNHIKILNGKVDENIKREKKIAMNFFGIIPMQVDVLNKVIGENGVVVALRHV